MGLFPTEKVPPKIATSSHATTDALALGKAQCGEVRLLARARGSTCHGGRSFVLSSSFDFSMFSFGLKGGFCGGVVTKH